MFMESFVLRGRHVRLEPLHHRHIDGFVAASAGDSGLYRLSPVPQSLDAARKYVETELAWNNAGTAIPFAMVQMSDGAVICSTRFWNLEYWAWPAGHASYGRRV